MRKSLLHSKLVKTSLISSSSTWERLNLIGQKNGLTDSNYSHDDRMKVPPALFSSRSRQTVMINNLEQGISYANKQYENLVRINSYIRQIITSCMNNRILVENGWSIYLDSIVVLTEERFTNFPLFGNGTEPPIRVHLIRDGVRFINEFPVNPLLSELHFQSLLHSGSQINPPPEKLLNSCTQDVIQQMLLTDRVIERSSHTLSELKEKSACNNKLLYGGPKKTRREPQYNDGNSLTFLSQLFRRLIKA